MGKILNKHIRFICISLSILLILSRAVLFCSDFSFSSLNMSNGLSNNSVFSFEQDSLGYMWIGTFGGLNRYDGTEFITYKPDPADKNSITSSIIFDICEDSQNRVWIGTDGGGLNLYDRVKNSFSSYRFDPMTPSTLSSDQVFTIFEDSSQTLWIGTGGGGLNRMNSDGTFFQYVVDPEDRFSIQSNIIRKIIQDSRGVLWIATDGGGLARYLPDRDVFSSYYYQEERVSEEKWYSSVKALFEDSQGRLWVGFEDGGLTVFDDFLKKFIPVHLNDNGDPISVRAITEDESGLIWVGSDGQGIFIIQDPLQDDMQITEVNVSQGELSSDRIRDIYIDMTGLLWIGMRDGGIKQFNPLSKAVKRVLTDHQIKEIVETYDHAIWAASDGGDLMRIDPDTEEITYPIKLNAEVQRLSYSLMTEGQYLWIGTDGAGLFKYHLSSGIVEEHFTTDGESNLQSDVIWDIFRDSRGILWVGTENGGLHAYDDSTGLFSFYQFETSDSSSIIGNSVREIFEDSLQDLWVGTWDGGLNRFISEEEGFERFTLIPGDLNSLSDNSVNSIYEDSAGRLWIGTTGGGLNLFNRETRTFTSFSIAEGMCSDNVFGILEDGDHKLWLPTDNGLAHFNPYDHSIINYWKEDGLIGNEFSHKAFLQDQSGTFYLGGRNGLSSFNPEDVVPRTVDSSFLITGLKLQNKDITVGPLVLEDSTELRSLLDKPLYDNPVLSLTPNDHFITFTFSLFDFVNSSKHQYAVKLDGLDTRWTDLEHKNSITFATIPPGSYTLRVRAKHYNGLEHPQELSMAINVEKFFYQQWYFILGVFLLFTAVTFLIFKLRVRALYRKNEMLRQYSIYIQEAREKKGKAIAREIHDQLGQVLTLLKFDLFRLKKQLAEPAIPKQAMIETSESAIRTVDDAIESVRTISTRLRPSALDSMSFAEALQWQMNEFSNRTGLKLSLDIANEDHEIPEELSIMIYRIIQEILTNIIRHAKASEVTCIFHENDTNYYLQIADDGVGCTQKQIKSKRAFGMISIHERCEAFGGTVRISSDAMKGAPLGGRKRHKGTRVELLFPVIGEV